MPVGVATGVFLAWWLGRLAASRLARRGPDLLFLMRTGRPGSAPGPVISGEAPATAAGTADASRPAPWKPPVPRPTGRQAAVSAFCWIFGAVMLFPQGLLPLIFLIVRADARSWYLALYLPGAWSWVTAFVMIAVGGLLFSQAVRMAVEGGRAAAADDGSTAASRDFESV